MRYIIIRLGLDGEKPCTIEQIDILKAANISVDYDNFSYWQAHKLIKCIEANREYIFSDTKRKYVELKKQSKWAELKRSFIKLGFKNWKY